MTSHRSFTMAAVWLLAPFALAQVPVTMTPSVTSTGGSVPQNIYAVDLNNDGVLDLVQDTIAQTSGFNVSIAKGDGSFKAPVLYSVSTSNSGQTSTSPLPIATGDFNNDGKADVVVQLSGTNQLEVFLGKGDGTFQAPKTVSVTLPAGYYLASAPIVAADFNQDGNIDLAVVASSSGTCCTNTVYVLEGNGAGSFSNPQEIYADTGSRVIDGVVVGDFDGDGKPDIALTDDGVMQGSYFGTALVVLYGSGGFTFDKTTAYTVSNDGQLIITAGDLNGDGKTDLFGVVRSTTEQIAIFYAGSSRTFDSYFMDLPGAYGDPSDPYFPQPLAPAMAMADFNGDGRMDLALAGYADNSSVPEIVYLLAGANPGEFTVQTSSLENLGSEPWYSNPVVADENHDTKPDLIINQASSNAATSSTIVTWLNGTPDGSWSGCLYPQTGNGIGLCSPVSGTSTTPVVFNASANSFGQLRKIELWVDGSKWAEDHYTWEHNAWFNASLNIAAGTHSATLFAADIDNRLSSLNFNFTVSSGSGCAAPSSVGVHVCLPTSHSAGPSPVQVTAAARIAGTLNRMEVWVDGVKKFSETSSLNLSTGISLSTGSHRFDVYAVNNAGTKYETTVYSTVN